VHAPAPPPTPPASPDADAALLARLRAGDDAAYGELVRAQTPVLLRLARRLLRDEAEAREAVQDAFVAVFRNLAGFRGQARLSTWIYRIAVNACLARLRARGAQPEVGIDDLLPRFLPDGHAAEPSVPWRADAALERSEVCARVRACIDRLPESYRTVVMLRDIEELTTEEAAEALGISPGAVKVRLHRARQALRTLLDPWMRGEQP
jgi:RNA polymerase sigma-70 factor (ECF subfamily)